MPATEETLLAFLNDLGVRARTHYHPAVFTVEEARTNRGALPGEHCKCLFVRDKKKRQALMVVEEGRPVDLKEAATGLGLGRLSFASPDRLQALLAVSPGSVTPFALINARAAEGETPPLTVVLDAHMMAAGLLNYHPLHNAATTAITPQNLLRFIRACGYSPLFFDFATNSLASRPIGA